MKFTLIEYNTYPTPPHSPPSHTNALSLTPANSPPNQNTTKGRLNTPYFRRPIIKFMPISLHTYQHHDKYSSIQPQKLSIIHGKHS